MKIQNIKYYQKGSKAVLSAGLVLKRGKTHNIFFEVDKEFKDYISIDASPFLATSLAIAMRKKEDLEIVGSISLNLMNNISKIMKIFVSWNQDFTPVLVKASTLEHDSKKPGITGCFFSGGADSFYTYQKNKDKINQLIFVHGFDINSEDFELYNNIEKNIIGIAKKENKKLIRVRTNIRGTLDQYFDWDLCHEFAIASVALFLSGGFKKIYLSCGQPSKNIDHRYLTPELDILWSTENMHLAHFGCNADKIDKLRFLSNSKLAMENLRVCWVNKKKVYNCSECEKCFRNMLGLYVSGSLGRCKTFNKILDPEKLKNIRLDEYCLKYFAAILEVMDVKGDRSSIRDAVEDCITNNTRPKFRKRIYWKSRDAIRFLDEKYNRNRLYWFFAKKGLVN